MTLISFTQNNKIVQFSSALAKFLFLKVRLGTRLCPHSILRFPEISLFFKTPNPGIWPPSGKQKLSCFVLFFQFYNNIYLFLCIYIFCISVLAPAKICLLFLGDRFSSKVSDFRDILQMLLDNIYLLVLSARDFPFLSFTLESVSVKLLHFVFCLYFLYS